jgi:hypothetical protein
LHDSAVKLNDSAVIEGDPTAKFDDWLVAQQQAGRGVAWRAFREFWWWAAVRPAG